MQQAGALMRQVRRSPGAGHWWLLALVLACGLALRLWGLSGKPLWSDEVLTWMLAGGHGIAELTLDRPVPARAMLGLLEPSPATCAQTAALVARDSNHPPLFFCFMNLWLSANAGEPTGSAADLEARLAWLRLPAVLFGMLAILAVYWLGRVAASPRVALLGAALAAVSPYAVYLSQEARHYSLPLALSAAGFAALIALVQDRRAGGAGKPWHWLVWVLAGLIGLYTHYLMGAVMMAQALVLVAAWWRIPSLRPRSLPAPGLAMLVLLIGYRCRPWRANARAGSPR